MENSFPAEPHHTAANPSGAVPETEPAEGRSSEGHEPTAEQVYPQAPLPDASLPGGPGDDGGQTAEDTPSGTPTDLDASLVDREAPEQEPTDAEPTHERESPFEEGSLSDFAARAQKRRLSPEEETEATSVLKESLLGGRTEVAKAVTATPFLPWVVSVQATAGAWPDMKPSFRAQFLAGLARTEGEQAARVRLSLARGLFKVDQAASLKLILLTLKLLRNKQTGLLEGKGPSLFSNVLIGRGKAWALQLPLQDLKPAEADLLVFAALHGAFHAPQAPVAQLGILRWAASEERLIRLPEALDALILKGISRWSAKWQSALRNEIAPLPESWLENLKTPGAKKNHPKTSSPDEEGELDEKPEDDEDLKQGSLKEGAKQSADESEHEESGDGSGERPDTEIVEDEDTEDESDDEDQEGDEDSELKDAPSRPQKHRPVYVSKTVPHNGNTSQQGAGGRRGGSHSAPPFNLQDTLRQIDNHVANLRSELQAAQKQLRQREADPRRSRKPEKAGPVGIPGDQSSEELLRLNQQLEARNAELKSRIDELTIDSEQRAASSGLTTDTPVSDPAAQLRTLLSFKLKDDYEDFLALQQEARDLVVQQHYRSVLQHVFDVLTAEGIDLKSPL